MTCNSTCLFQLSWGLKLYSSETWALIVARAIVGLGVSGSYVVTPLYIKEISEDSCRGTLGSLVVLAQNLGNLVVYLLGMCIISTSLVLQQLPHVLPDLTCVMHDLKSV